MVTISDRWRVEKMTGVNHSAVLCSCLVGVAGRMRE